MNWRLAGLAAALVLVSCYTTQAGGPGLPELAVQFPEYSKGGEIQEAVLTISNPGPEPFTGISVAFVRVGPGPQGGPLPRPIVDGIAQTSNGAVVSVSPKPLGTSIDGIAFNFGPLAEGDDRTIRFKLRLPVQPGEAANSILVYDSRNTDRIKGIRLSTIVRG